VVKKDFHADELFRFSFKPSRVGTGTDPTHAIEDAKKVKGGQGGGRSRIGLY